MVLVLALAQSIGSLLLPRLMADIVDKGIVLGNQRAIFEIGGLMLLMSIVATLCAIGGSYYSAKVATGFGRILRGAIFARGDNAHRRRALSGRPPGVILRETGAARPSAHPVWPGTARAAQA